MSDVVRFDALLYLCIFYHLSIAQTPALKTAYSKEKHSHVVLNSPRGGWKLAISAM